MSKSVRLDIGEGGVGIEHHHDVAVARAAPASSRRAVVTRNSPPISCSGIACRAASSCRLVTPASPRWRCPARSSRSLRRIESCCRKARDRPRQDAARAALGDMLRDQPAQDRGLSGVPVGDDVEIIVARLVARRALGRDDAISPGAAVQASRMRRRASPSASLPTPGFVEQEEHVDLFQRLDRLAVRYSGPPGPMPITWIVRIAASLP